jgi:2-polyprenyl-6-methoxyphenol hydroxylase-like FAD-dependent oxidoreductase
MSPTDQDHHDIIVVGARVAGAATALLLARQGLDVLLLDREPPGLDTLSTHALMRGAVVQLARWGLLEELIALGTPPVEHVVFRYGDDRTSVDLRDRAGPLYAPRREVLDPLLVEAARAAGATVHHATTVERVLRDPISGRVTGVVTRPTSGARGWDRELYARHVIGADGRTSKIARGVDAVVQHRGTASGACIYRHVAELPTSGYEWIYRPGLGAGMIPTNGGRTCVWVGAPTARFLRERHLGIDEVFDRLLAEAAPEVAERLRWLPRGRPWGYPGHPSVVREPWGPGWALVGDAGAYRDPITAHGITDALRDAELLADAITAIHRDEAPEAVALRAFHNTRDRLGMPIVSATDRIASYDWDLSTLHPNLLELSEAMQVEARFLRQLASSAVNAA